MVGVRFTRLLLLCFVFREFFFFSCVNKGKNKNYESNEKCSSEMKNHRKYEIVTFSNSRTIFVRFFLEFCILRKPYVLCHILRMVTCICSCVWNQISGHFIDGVRDVETINFIFHLNIATDHIEMNRNRYPWMDTEQQ